MDDITTSLGEKESNTGKNSERNLFYPFFNQQEEGKEIKGRRREIKEGNPIIFVANVYNPSLA